MTELDLSLKVSSRRLLWRMGFSTRVDVPLRALSPAQPARAADTSLVRGRGSDQRPAGARNGGAPRSGSPESFTDLDVLGISLAPGFRVQSAIVDCKTGSSSAISRMFWLRGLTEFFTADSTYMVRERAISPGGRQLARRLGIAALTGSEVSLLEELHPTALPLESEPLSLLFDEEHVAKVFSRLAEQDRRIKSLVDFQQFDYWVFDEHLNLMQVVEHLARVSSSLSGSNSQHLGIVLDCAWLYVLSLAHALEAVRDVHISDVAYGLREYMMGGINRLKEREQLQELFGRLQARGQIPSDVDVSALPAYFQGVLELATRLLRRGELIVDAMRYLEVTSSLAIGGVRMSAAQAFQSEFDPVVGKLAMNVVAFLVRSAGLNPQLGVLANELLTSVSESDAPAHVVGGSQHLDPHPTSQAVKFGAANTAERSEVTPTESRPAAPADRGTASASEEPTLNEPIELDLGLEK